MQAASQLREKEQERSFERQLLKERKAEDALYGDQPNYITAAYKEKLMESKKWELEDKMMEEVEKRHDVRSLGMQGFYSNLLTKNLAMGGDVKSNAISAYTAGSQRQEQVLTDASQKTSVYEDGDRVEGEVGKQQTGRDSASTAEKDRDHHSSSKRSRSDSHHNGGDDDDIRHQKRQNIEEGRAGTTDSSSVDKPPDIAQKKEEVVLSARERYLARKQQQQNTGNLESST